MVFKKILNMLRRSKADKYDCKRLAKTAHMFNWLHPDPFNEIYRQADHYVKSMVPDSHIIEFSIETDPDWLTGGPLNNAKQKMTLRRTGVCFEFKMIVKSMIRGNEIVNGTFSWVAVDLDCPQTRQRIWFDINGKLKDFGSGGLLKIRVLDIDGT